MEKSNFKVGFRPRELSKKLRGVSTIHFHISKVKTEPRGPISAPKLHIRDLLPVFNLLNVHRADPVAC